MSENQRKPTMQAALVDFYRQFKVLTWKNSLLRTRNLGTLFLEVAVPVAIILAIGGLSKVLPPMKYKENIPSEYTPIQSFRPTDQFNLYHGIGLCNSYGNLVYLCEDRITCPNSILNISSVEEQLQKCQPRKIGIAPSSSTDTDSANAAKSLVEWANKRYDFNNFSTFVYFESESAFVSYLTRSGYGFDSDPVYSAGVIFGSAYPKWQYTLRLNNTYVSSSQSTNAVSTSSKALDISIKTSSQTVNFGDPFLEAYIYSGELALADVVNSFIASSTCQKSGGKCKDTENVELATLGGIDFPSYKVEINQFWSAIGFIFALLMILTLLYPIANVIRSLVQEKETKLKEGMMMMALRGDAHYVSWIVHFTCLFLPLSIILMAAGKILFVYSNSWYIFIYFLLFFMSATSYAFLISKLFNRALTAAIVGCVIFFMGFFIYIGLTSGNNSNPSRSSILAASLHPACAFTFGTLAFAEYEGAQVGITEKTWNVSTLYPISFQDSLNMMFADTIWMAFLSWYIGKIWPSEFGTHLPWYFLFLPSYWLSCIGIKKENSVASASSKNEDENIPVEPVSEGLRIQVENNKCVNIKNLYKEFETPSGTKVAVDGLDLTIYSGQITALLGHNGAGKTTVISMLTGLITPDSGTAIIEGLDITTDLPEIRRNLGVCPQHDVLFPDLTVEEHLILFASFKGAKGDYLKKEVEDMINAVGLTEKKKARSKELSGGQKRKLSVGIAFIGGSRVVFLDEPTSGMDPYSRRFTWNVIRQHRENRVIVLTTHFMDEADLLGDRVAIMGDGKLKCCGSSLFLKGMYGVGYNMTIEKLNPHEFNSGKVVDHIVSYVPEAKILTDAGSELTVQLPLTSSNKFQTLFDYIDDNDSSLGIRSYGMSVTTLEEVFIKVAHGTATQALQDEQKKKGGHVEEESGREKANPITDFKKIDDEDYWSYFVRHMHAMLLKRALYFSRDRKAWVFQYGVPLGMVLIGMIIQNITSTITESPSIDINIDLYNDGIGTNYLPTVYNDAQPFCIPTIDDTFQIGQTCSNFNGQSLFANSIPLASEYPVIPDKSAHYIQNMSSFILAGSDSYEASQIGALTIFDAVNYTTTGIPQSVEYFVHGNYSALHAGPLFQLIMAQSVLNQIDSTSSVSLTIHPLPYTDSQKKQISGFIVDIIVTFILLAIPFLCASFTSYVVREREIKSKHVQMVSGVSVYSYWLATWIWDFVSYQPTLWIIVILVAIFPGTEVLTSVSSGALGKMIGLLILFGTSISGFCYCLSYLFKTPSGAQIITVFIIFVLGLILSIVGQVLRIIPSTSDVYNDTLKYIFCVFPPFALGDGLHNLALIQTWSLLELEGGEKYSVNDWKITGANLVFLAWESFFFLFAAIAYEYLSQVPSFQALFASSGALPVDNTIRDEDVLEEEKRVASGAASDSTILVKDLKKMYPGGKYAVRGVSLGIPNGECFGLLGINGAGKSTTLSMLSGEFKPTTGEAFLGGVNLLTDVHKCRRKIGFCPQFDALFDLLTGREHLELYARIKGIAEEDIKKVVEGKIAEMGLTEYAGRSAQTYSGGNKRKLSVAIAMIGEPSIVFLDEPSTGMDPVARRFMWEVITDIVTKRESCSMILTTHSMEECEALCTRIGIMVGGVLRCLGSSQRLRTRYGHGYQIEIGMVLPSSEAVQVQVEAISEVLGQVNPDNIDRASVEKAFRSLGRESWVERLNSQGSGSELLALIPNLTLKYFATWWITEQAFDGICNFLVQHFGGFVLRERQLSKIRVEVSAFEVKEGGQVRRRLGTMFGLIENNKKTLSIQDYSIAQTSLEQIFNQFAAQQDEEKGHATGIL